MKSAVEVVPWPLRVAAQEVSRRLDEAGGALRSKSRRPRLSFDGEAIRWSRSGETLEVELHRTPCNEIGTTALDEYEYLAEFIEGGAAGARAILFHSSVERGFCAGADLRELHAGLLSHDSTGGTRWGAAKQVRSFLDRIHHVFNVIDAAPMTTIGVIHGFCFGGGFELALTCDVLVAEKSARFAFPELRLGLVPGFGGIPRLRRDVGNSVIRDVLFTGRSISAKRAYELGLVSQLVARGKGLEVARQVGIQAARFDPSTTAAAKRFAKPIPFAELEREKDLFIRLLGSPTVERALRKFVESDAMRPYLP